MNKTIRLLLSTLFILPSASAAAELSPTDRPDFTESTSIVQPLNFQFESGYTFTYDRRSGGYKEKTHTLPELLVRTGVTEGVELRLFFEGYNRNQTKIGNNRSSNGGYADLNLGTKVNLVEGETSFSLLGDVSIPTGSTNRTADKAVPTLKFLWSTEMTDIHTLSGNINATAQVDENNDRYFEPAASVAVGKELSQQISVFYEYFGIYPVNTGKASSHFLGGGLTFTPLANLQLDWRLGFGLNTSAEDVFTGIGASFKL